MAVDVAGMPAVQLAGITFQKLITITGPGEKSYSFHDLFLLRKDNINKLLVLIKCSGKSLGLFQPS